MCGQNSIRDRASAHFDIDAKMALVRGIGSFDVNIRHMVDAYITGKFTVLCSIPRRTRPRNAEEGG